eukprot:TRINITY_DN4870_c0_g1_i5.p1 TRINITY_DN4870_c0_g1~~TRINITY_DN4870_c0_g1_i5.p1  ORF type:complete len:392 (-),score=59.84 TRINITY_DN4870_c0_g1_i5:206-1381(-)
MRITERVNEFQDKLEHVLSLPPCYVSSRLSLFSDRSVTFLVVDFRRRGSYETVYRDFFGISERFSKIRELEIIKSEWAATMLPVVFDTLLNIRSLILPSSRIVQLDEEALHFSNLKHLERIELGIHNFYNDTLKDIFTLPTLKQCRFIGLDTTSNPCDMDQLDYCIGLGKTVERYIFCNYCFSNIDWQFPESVTEVEFNDCQRSFYILSKLGNAITSIINNSMWDSCPISDVSHLFNLEVLIYEGISAKTSDELDILLKLTKLRELEITLDPPREWDFEILTQFKHLQVLDLSSSRYLDGLKCKFITSMPSLKVIHFGTEFTDLGFTFLKKCESLEELYFIKSRISYLGLTALKALKNLRIISIRGCSMGYFPYEQFLNMFPNLSLKVVRR